MADEMTTQATETTAATETTGTNTQTGELERLKAALAKANTEAGNYRKQLRERQSAEEAEAAERAEREEAREQLLKTLLREKTENHYGKRLMSLGMTEVEATKTAKGLPDGIEDTFFDGLVKFKADFEKNIRADITKNTPKLESAGSNFRSASLTKEQFDAMGYIDRVNLIKDDPETYEKFTKGE